MFFLLIISLVTSVVLYWPHHVSCLSSVFGWRVRGVVVLWVTAVSPGKPRLDSSSERERSCWADDTVKWNSSDFCASVFCVCFLSKIGYHPSVMSHWFFSEMWNLFYLAPCVPMKLNEQNACRNRIICYYSWKNIGLPKWYCSFTSSDVF